MSNFFPTNIPGIYREYGSNRLIDTNTDDSAALYFVHQKYKDLTPEEIRDRALVSLLRIENMLKRLVKPV